MTWRISVGSASDKGRVRDRNEDAYRTYLSDREKDRRSLADAFFAIADGAGGHEQGDLASRFAVESVERAINDAPDTIYDRRLDLLEWMVELFQRLNRELRDMAVARGQLQGMKSTLTLAVFQGETLYLAHVGDTRCYVLRDSVFRQLTEDHSWPAAQRRAGLLTPQEERLHPDRNLLTQCLGVNGNLDVWVVKEPMRPGDRLLLCSDGLHGAVDDEHLARVLEEEPDPSTAAPRLIDMGIEGGSHDNLTALVVHVDAEVSRRDFELPDKPVSGTSGGRIAESNITLSRMLGWATLIVMVAVAALVVWVYLAT